jgi:hypothetical protein
MNSYGLEIAAFSALVVILWTMAIFFVVGTSGVLWTKFWETRNRQRETDFYRNSEYQAFREWRDQQRKRAIKPFCKEN